jgi:membrane protein implicated in regulation of membrane protease activity
VDAGTDFGAGDIQGVGDLTALFRRIPVSSYSFVLSFFGVMGLVGTGLGFGTIATFLFALILGLIAGGVNTAAFSWLRKTNVSSHFTDRQLSGRIATVSVPIEDGKRGRVWIDTGDERVQLTANALNDDEGNFMRGDQVVIIDVENSIAKVTRAPELED